MCVRPKYADSVKYAMTALILSTIALLCFILAGIFYSNETVGGIFMLASTGFLIAGVFYIFKTHCVCCETQKPADTPPKKKEANKKKKENKKKQANKKKRGDESEYESEDESESEDEYESEDDKNHGKEKSSHKKAGNAGR